MLREAVTRLVPPARAFEFRDAFALHWQVAAVAVLVLLAAAVRLVDIADNPRGFFTDEASFGLNAHLILTTGRDEHGEFLPVLFRSFGEYKLPVFIYAEVPFVAVFGRSEFAVRATAAVLGSLTVVTTYLAGRELFRRELTAVAGAAFLAIVPWHIHYSRTGLGDIVAFPLLFTFALYLFLRALREGRSLVPAAVAFGLTFYTYRAAWVVVPPVVMLLGVLYYRELWERRRDALYAGAIVLLILVPLVRHLLSDTGDRVSASWIFKLDPDQGILRLFWDFFKSYFTESFLFSHGDNGPITRHYLPGHGVLYWFQLPLAAAGLLALLLRPRRSHIFVLALLLLFPLSGALSDTSPISSRTILGSVVFSLICAAGVTGTVDLASKFRRPYTEIVTAGVILVVGVVAAISFASYTSTYHSDYPRLSAGYWGWQDGPQSVVERFVAVQDRYDELILDGEFNAPHIFFSFYAGDACGKCSIGNAERFDPGERQLFALRPYNISQDRFDYTVLDSLYYPGGELAFVFVEIKARR